MTKDELRARVEACVRRRGEMYAGQDSDYEIMPFLEVYDGDAVTIFGCQMPNLQAKENIAFLMAVLVFVGAEAVIFSSESWIVKAGGDDELKAYNAWRDAHPNASLGEYPGAMEINMAVGSCGDGQAIASAEIIRERGKAPRLGDVALPEYEDGNLKSRFTDRLNFRDQVRFSGMKVGEVVKMLANSGMFNRLTGGTGDLVTEDGFPAFLRREAAKYN